MASARSQYLIRLHLTAFAIVAVLTAVVAWLLAPLGSAAAVRGVLIFVGAAVVLEQLVIWLLVRQILQKQVLARQNQRLLDDLQAKNNELNSANAKLMSMATTDPLTGTYNRRYILARLEQQFQQAQRYGEPFALLMLDIDHFKRINDTYGHQVGDEVLRHFSLTVRSLIRGSDLFGRYGGEEFMLILGATPPAAAQAAVERLRASVGARDWTEFAPDLKVTVSAGVTGFRRGETVSQLLSRADSALYDAKHAGRDCVVVRD